MIGRREAWWNGRKGEEGRGRNEIVNKITILVKRHKEIINDFSE